MAATKSLTDAETCPCRAPMAGSGPADQSERKSYANCCKPWHLAGFAGLGATPEITMRSRYSAYVAHDENYLLATWHTSTRPSAVEFPTNVQWHGLSVLATDGSSFDGAGSVEFSARFRRDDAHLELHEHSTFLQENGRWFYVEGLDPDARI